MTTPGGPAPDRYQPGPQTNQEDRRITRALNLLARINAEPRQWTRRRLAAHYRVSERTITKDLAVLEHALAVAVLHARTGYYLAAPLPLPAPRGWPRDRRPVSTGRPAGGFDRRAGRE